VHLTASWAKAMPLPIKVRAMWCINPHIWCTTRMGLTPGVR